MSCCATLGNIEKTCGAGNKPGLKQKFWLTCVDQVNTIPAPAANTHEITANITMRAAAVGPPLVAAGKFFEFDISKFESGLEADPQGDSENQSWLVTASVFINRQDKTKAYILNGMSGGEFIAVFPDGNGEKHLIGELDNGCNVTVKAQTNDKNGYLLTITWETNRLPYFYNGTLVLA